jgi:hypothetical protein
MWDISQMYGLGLKYLLKYNRMKNSQKLQHGSVIWLQKTRPKNQPIEVLKESVEEKENLPVKENYTQKEEVSIETTPNAEKKYEEIEKPKAILNNEEVTNAETKPSELKEVAKAETKSVEVNEVTKAETKPSEVKSDGLKIDDDIFEPKNNTKLPTNTPPLFTCCILRNDVNVLVEFCPRLCLYIRSRRYFSAAFLVTEHSSRIISCSSTNESIKTRSHPWSKMASITRFGFWPSSRSCGKKMSRSPNLGYLCTYR